MKICPSCKANISDEKSYCPMCGANLNSTGTNKSITNKVRTVISAMGVLIMLVLSLSLCTAGHYLKTDFLYIETIKSDSPDGYSMTYEEMFDKELKKVEWDYNSSSKEVIVTGYSEDLYCKFTFDIDDEGGKNFYYSLKEASVGGMPFTDYMADLLVLGMFDEAISNY